MSDFETQREDALLTLDQDVDQFVLITWDGYKTKTVFGAKESAMGSEPSHLDLLQQGTKSLFRSSD